MGKYVAMGMSCVATCSKGLEGVLASELAGMGMTPEVAAGAVRFKANWAQVVRANFWLRTAIRVLVELAQGPCRKKEDLYELTSSIAWEDLLSSQATIAVKVAGKHPAFVNTHYAALVVKDAVVDRLRARTGVRPSVSVASPDFRIVVRLEPNASTISLDTSGEPLSHRKYRPKGALAPMSEALAAGLLLLAGFDGKQPFFDPMCGSGTLVVEACLLAKNQPPGAFRRFAFERWPFVDGSCLDRERERSRELQRPVMHPIVGQEIDPHALGQAQQAAAAAGVARDVTWRLGDVRALPEIAPGTLMVSNPPYGHRLGEEENLRRLYRAMGDAFKRQAQGSTVWLLCGNLRLMKEVGLKAQRKIIVFNGPLSCRFCSYPIVEGRFKGACEATS